MILLFFVGWGANDLAIFSWAANFLSIFRCSSVSNDWQAWEAGCLCLITFVSITLRNYYHHIILLEAKVLITAIAMYRSNPRINVSASFDSALTVNFFNIIVWRIQIELTFWFLVLFQLSKQSSESMQYIFTRISNLLLALGLIFHFRVLESSADNQDIGSTLYLHESIVNIYDLKAVCGHH